MTLKECDAVGYLQRLEPRLAMMGKRNEKGKRGKRGIYYCILGPTRAHDRELLIEITS